MRKAAAGYVGEYVSKGNRGATSITKTIREIEWQSTYRKERGKGAHGKRGFSKMKFDVFPSLGSRLGHTAARLPRQKGTGQTVRKIGGDGVTSPLLRPRV
ncbi:hypothetical protein MTO96_013534 [Rhipicephalus appendiculatus]